MGENIEIPENDSDPENSLSPCVPLKPKTIFDPDNFKPKTKSRISRFMYRVTSNADFTPYLNAVRQFCHFL